MSADADQAWRRLKIAAWLTLGAHLAAGAATALILRPGLETNSDVSARLHYVAENRALWVAGWLIWNVAALSILNFYVCFVAAHVAADRTRLRLVLLLCAAGIAPDLAAEGIYMGLLPGLAARAVTDPGSANADLFFALARAAVMMTGYVANGLYSLATLLLVWTTRTAYQRPVVILGYVVGASGLALSAAALADSVTGLVGAHFVLIPSLLIWQAGVALDAARRARAEGV